MIFSAEEQQSFYRLLEARRDVRQDFLPKEIPPDVLQRILQAAHHAPSVGFMQPWNFVIIRSEEKKERVKEAFHKARSKEAEIYEGEKRELYDSLKLEGILEAPINICVTCDRTRDGQTGLGRSQQTEMDLYSTVCAVQNMWLAARVEHIGMGWVSIVDKAEVREILQIPDHIEIVAYLCLGYVKEFQVQPDLESKGWAKRLDLDTLVFEETWG